MEKKRILYISQEIVPYFSSNKISEITRSLPQQSQENGKDTRTFMPRFGLINERRNQLHEVIRLSGMSIRISEVNYPLVIKVASIQEARMQVYFIDNEDYFSRKASLYDTDGKPFNDNDERAIFFARGVLEAIIKLRWMPDIIHCHGWFTSLVPLYAKKHYHNEPILQNAKILYSVYNEDLFENHLNSELKQKAVTKTVTETDLALITEASFINLNKIGMHYADGIVQGSTTIHEELLRFARNQEKPFLQPEADFAYQEFYDSLLPEPVPLT